MSSKSPNKIVTVQSMCTVNFGSIWYSLPLPHSRRSYFPWIPRPSTLLSQPLPFWLCAQCFSSRLIHRFFFLYILNILPREFYLTICADNFQIDISVLDLFIYLASPLAYLRNQNYTLASILYLVGHILISATWMDGPAIHLCMQAGYLDIFSSTITPYFQFLTNSCLF